MSDVTFRDFASAVMKGDNAGASEVLSTLLSLAPDRAATSTAHFRARMNDPAFLPKAMSLRTAVTTGTDEEINSLLEDCFALVGADAAGALAAIRARYPRT
jgi:hypothetical protein